MKLGELDKSVQHIPTPLAFAEHLYVFREHIDLMERRIEQRLAAAASLHLAGAVPVADTTQPHPDPLSRKQVQAAS